MATYSFMDDYSEGCHPQILEALIASNLEQHKAYGEDNFSSDAKALIQKHLKNADASIFFVAGGTLANLILASSLLKSHEAIIAVETGHIVQRETGAIEAVGNKIIVMPSFDGKLTPSDVMQALKSNAHAPHMAKPRLVYISNATETGRLYTKSEITALSECCRAQDLLFMVDGARLGVALTSDQSDLTLADLSRLTDVFWIGGTKAGALIGEAIIINTPDLAKDFAFHIKQRGALLAKGRLLGLQFKGLFETDLFFSTSKFANGCAQKLSRAIEQRGYALASKTQTNQIFPILPNALIERLQRQFEFYIWEETDADHSVLRLVTSWATEGAQIEAFIQALDL